MVNTAEVVIVGTGLAGYSVAREFRKLSQATLALATSDAGIYYSKPMLSNAFTSGKTPESIAIAPAEKMALDLSAEIRNHTDVTKIERSLNLLHCGDTRIEYGRLVLALGADPIAPPLAGEAMGEVFQVNDLDDYVRFRTAIAAAKHVVIIGAGLIGCEFANDLRSAGLEVDVVDPAHHPLGRLVPEAVGLALRQALTGVGVNWELGTTVAEINYHKNRLRVIFADGRQRETDAVLSAIGLRPRTELARAAGLSCGRGITTDKFLATSDPAIFALGDCAEISGLVLPYVMPIMHASRALAKTLAGVHTPVEFPPMPVIVKTTAYPVVVSPPSHDAQGVWLIHADADNAGVKALFKDPTNQLLGFALAGTAVQEKNSLTKELAAKLPN